MYRTDAGQLGRLLVLSLPLLGECLKTNPLQHYRRVFGPEHRNCQADVMKRQRHRIVNGKAVTSLEKYPFLAWIGDDDGTGLSQFCGGSLVDERIVLTAAHCLYSNETMNAQIYTRLNVLNFKRTPGLARSVVNWRKHPRFDSYTMYNDLALLLLNESVSPLDAPPVALSDGSDDLDPQSLKTIAGWGSMDEECAVYDTHLHDAEIPLGTDGENCNVPGGKTLTKKLDFDHRLQLCGGRLAEEEETVPGCGDSGGPLLKRQNDTWSVVGLVSWSYGPDYPDVFTRVSVYTDWINATSEELKNEGPKQLSSQ